MFWHQCVSLLLSISCIASTSGAAPARLRALYRQLEPTSLSQHLAFYELYPDTPEGKQALQDAWRLLNQHKGNNAASPDLIASLPQAPEILESIIALVNRLPGDATPVLNEELLVSIESLTASLPHRQLKGHGATSEAEVLDLPTEEIDLARALFLSQLDEDPQKIQKTRSYEAMIDLMALQIAAALPPQATPKDKIRVINHAIFEEMGFRFPSHSTYAKDIDLYTFLPSVLDSRRGVCLGVSILYLALAQRLELNLEPITPPGHIYVRYRDGNTVCNIETTARGIHIDSESYLGVETRALQQRTIKEVVGLAHMNQASTYYRTKEYERAMQSLEKGLKYLPEDILIKELLGYTSILAGDTAKGKRLLKNVQQLVPDHAVAPSSVPIDYLAGNADAAGIEAVLMPVDETRASLITKKEALEKALERTPKFREGILYLAITHLQLHRSDDAVEILQRYHDLDPTNPSVEYYLSMLGMERLNYPQAWNHLRQAETLVDAYNHHPKALKELRRELNSRSPE